MSPAADRSVAEAELKISQLTEQVASLQEQLEQARSEAERARQDGLSAKLEVLYEQRQRRSKLEVENAAALATLRARHAAKEREWREQLAVASAAATNATGQGGARALLAPLAARVEDIFTTVGVASPLGSRTLSSRLDSEYAPVPRSST